MELEPRKITVPSRKFFCSVKEVHLTFIDDPNDATCGVAMTTCFDCANVTSLLNHLIILISELTRLNLSSMISHLSLEKVRITADFELENSLGVELAEILLRQESLQEVILNECSFIDDSDFLSQVSTILQNPSFCKFHFDGGKIPSVALAQLLSMFLSTECSHSQLLSLESYMGITADDFLRKQQFPMSSAICESALQH